MLHTSTSSGPRGDQYSFAPLTYTAWRGLLNGKASRLPKRALMKPPPQPKGSMVVSLIIPFILSKFVVHKATSHNQTLYSETLP